jgi:hypothetical protein
MPLDNASSRVGVMCLLIGIRYLCTYKGGCLLDLRIHITSMSIHGLLCTLPWVTPSQG